MRRYVMRVTRQARVHKAEKRSTRETNETSPDNEIFHLYTLAENNWCEYEPSGFY